MAKKNTEETAAEQVQPTVETEQQPDPMAELQNQLEAEKDARLRLAAEYDNFRKRTARERETLFTDAKVLAVAEFLTVYDNLERAVATPTQDTAYAKGVEMILAELKQVMEKLKVEEIDPQGGKFDPNLHNAVMHVEDDALEPGVVAEVFQKGFKIGDKVVRHAMVKVAN